VWGRWKKVKTPSNIDIQRKPSSLPLNPNR
jgi:hypothetical protein